MVCQAASKLRDQCCFQKGQQFDELIITAIAIKRRHCEDAESCSRSAPPLCDEITLQGSHRPAWLDDEEDGGLELEAGWTWSSYYFDQMNSYPQVVLRCRSSPVCGTWAFRLHCRMMTRYGSMHTCAPAVLDVCTSVEILLRPNDQEAPLDSPFLGFPRLGHFILSHFDLSRIKILVG